MVWFRWRGEHRHRGVVLERIGRRTRAVDERAERRRTERTVAPTLPRPRGKLAHSPAA